MNGVTFGGYHSYDDFNLILTNIEIEPPEVQTYTVEVPGRNGVLDLTDSLFDGEVKYSNRTVKFEFDSVNFSSSWHDENSTLLDSIHGQKLKIVLDEDPEYYYYGRITAENKYESGEVVINIDAQPFKYKLSETSIMLELTKETEVTLYNEFMPAIPTIETDGEITIECDEGSYVFSEGTFISTGLTLSAGYITWTITPTDSANVTITYQEGRL